MDRVYVYGMSIDSPDSEQRILSGKTNFPEKGVGAGWCVDYVKYVTGTNLGGDAWEWKKYINSDRAYVGEIVVLSEGLWGHLAVVREVRDYTIVISEQNFTGRYIISEREIFKDDPDIEGYIY